MQLQDAIDDPVHAPADDDLVEDIVEGNVLVGHFGMRLEGDHAPRLLQLRGELAHVEAVRAIGIVAAIGPRGLVVLGDEDRAGHPPVRAIGFVSALDTPFGVIGPLALQTIKMQEVGGDRPPAASAERNEAFGVRIRCRAGNRRMGFLIGLDHIADADLGPQRLHRRDGPVFPLQVDRCRSGPQRQNMIDRFREHVVAVGIQQSECLGVRAKNACADAEDESPFEQVVEHRRIRGHHDRMGVRKIDHRGPDFDLGGHAEQRCDEHHAVRDVLGGVGEVLAAIAFAVSEPVGENKGFAILLERLDVASRRRMDRHREISKFHAFLRSAGRGRRRILVLWRPSHKSLPASAPAFLAFAPRATRKSNFGVWRA
jgi:hypothetical protein